MEQSIVEQGKVVSLRYRLEDSSGALIEETFTGAEPYSYLHGARQVIAGLEQLLEGRRVGEKLSAVLPPEAAYGASRRLVTVRTADFPQDASMSIGATVACELDTGAPCQLRVIAISDDLVYCDCDEINALAGKALHYTSLEVVALRDASPAELRSARLIFPFDLFQHVRMPGPVGERIAAVRHLCMFPPYPWGQWLYARIFEALCAGLDGDLIEAGVGLGGTSIFLGQIARRLGKRVHAYDSFEGLPPPDVVHDNPYFVAGDYAFGDPTETMLAKVERQIDRFGLRGVVMPVKGFFRDSLGDMPPDQRFCFAHLDSDLYDSVRESLEAIYPRLVDGGILVIDDFFHHAMGPRRAASDFFNRSRIRPVYHVAFPYSVFIIKGERPSARHGKRSIDGNWYSFDWLRQDDYFVGAVKRSLERARSVEERAHQNAAMLLDVLKSSSPRSSDVYMYWRALEDFWDSTADELGQREPNRGKEAALAVALD